MEKYIIRMAKISDIQNILPLMVQLGYPTTIENLQNRFETFTSIEGYGVAVACTEDDDIIGWIAWSKSFLFILDKARIHIEGLVIKENYRKNGIGKKLILFVENIAKNSALSTIIDLTSGHRRANDGSHEFYKNLGYSNDGHMAKLYLRKEI